MGTQFTTVYNRFLSKITDDMYMELTPEDTIKDLQKLLINAIPGFEFPRKNLNDYILLIDKIPLSDYQKRRALKDKIGFDVDAALRHIEEEKAEMRADSENAIEPTAPQRRVKTEETAPGRRTDGKYKIVSQDNK